MVEPRALVGQELAGFRVTAVLGQGGGVPVLRGENVLDRKIVRALKVLPPELAARSEAARSFAEEARTLELLRHGNVVGFHGLRKDRDHLVMELELLEGNPLSTILQGSPGLRTPIRSVVEWLRQASEGVAVAHSLGIVHRDLKPKNLFLTRAGEIKVLDFGITPGASAYTAPEVSDGTTAAPTADVYALGISLLEMLLGHHPRVDAQLPLCSVRPDVPPLLEQIVRRATSRDPRERYPLARDLADALGGVTDLLLAEGSAPGPGLHSTPHDDRDVTAVHRAQMASTARFQGPGRRPRASIPPERPPERALPEGPRYSRLRSLGQGGMGEVFECTDELLGRRVAVKFPRADLPEPAVAEALRREARVAGNLEHPNIVPVYDASSPAEPIPHYVMRLVEKTSLETMLESIKAGGAAAEDYTIGRLLRYFIQVCQAIEYAHSRGVIHCDLKPSNVLLGAFGEVIVVDWGLAFRTGQDEAPIQGGTPGFMAPEQLETGPDRIGPRTDVFALGAILYELLTLEPAFPPVAGKRGLRMSSVQVPVRPRARAPGRNIPEELEDLCMKALVRDPAERLPSARAMATSIEAFLEGTKERERRAVRADQLAAQGAMLADYHGALLRSRIDWLAELSTARQRVSSWAPAELKREIWEAEDRLGVQDNLSIRTFHKAVSLLEQALQEVPQHPTARRRLALLYQAALRWAEDRRDEFHRVYFEELLREYDDDAQAHTRVPLVLACSEIGIEASLSAVHEVDRKLVAVEEASLGPTPCAPALIAPGHYVATFRGRGLRELRHPVQVHAGQAVRIEVDLTAAADADPDEIFIPGGLALLAGDSGTNRNELRPLALPAFFIQERPVDFAGYLEFVAEMYRLSPNGGDPFLPGSADKNRWWRWTGTEFLPAAIREFGAEPWTLPVFGVDVASAEAYARWKSSPGRHYRLPSELEWEKAARGTDGRSYPWGNHFDAAFCKNRESRPGLPAPEPSGAFPDDVSPYGVRDMAGGVAEWTVPIGPERVDHSGVRHMVVRGGAWCDWGFDCQIGARRHYLASERSARVGIRLARSVTPSVKGRP